VHPSPIPVTPGWGPTTWVNIALTLLVAVLGSGGLWGIFRGVALLWKMNNESKKQDNDAAAGVRREMMEISERQQKRIDELEKSGREERGHFDRELAEIRKAHAEEMAAIRLAHAAEMASLREKHAEEMRALRDEVIGAHRNLIQAQQSSGKAVRISKSVPGQSNPELDALIDRMGDLPNAGE